MNKKVQQINKQINTSYNNEKISKLRKFYSSSSPTLPKVYHEFYTLICTPRIPSIIVSSDLRSFINESIRYISFEDSKYLFDDLTKDKTQFTKEEAFEIYYNFQNQAGKVFNRVQPQIGMFILQSLIKIQPSQQKDIPSLLIADNSQYINERKVDINRSFSYILTEDYLRKLVNMGANGLINEKQEEKIQRYFYNHWVESSEKTFLLGESEKLEVQLLKRVWMFEFKQVIVVGEKILQLVSSFNGNTGNNNNSRYELIKGPRTQLQIVSDEEILSLSEISSLMPGLQNLGEMERILQKHPQLRALIENRMTYALQFRQDILRKHVPTLTRQQLAILHQQFNELIQLWTFTQDYFEIIEPQIVNPYYKQIIQFITLRDNDKDKLDEEVEDFAQLEDIGIIQRFLYAKKYFTVDQFELFKNKIKQHAPQIENLNYILLFGNRKDSQLILQNYLNRTGDIQKVALISVYLKTFSEQTRMITSLRIGEHKSCYSKFIYVYEWLLDKIQGGIAKHQFDKKCLDIEIERKTKNLTKTFTFDCTNCKAPQIYSILSKKINIDAKQPKLKGYHYFAKDNRIQIMHCIECMIMLPKCSICLYPISVYNAYAEEMKKNATQKKATNKGEPINKAVVWCPKCKHGGHFDHIMSWFSQDKRKCPVANCKCKCSL